MATSAPLTLRCKQGRLIITDDEVRLTATSPTRSVRLARTELSAVAILPLYGGLLRALVFSDHAGERLRADWVSAATAAKIANMLGFPDTAGQSPRAHDAASLPITTPDAAPSVATSTQNPEPAVPPSDWLGPELPPWVVQRADKSGQLTHPLQRPPIPRVERPPSAPLQRPPMPSVTRPILPAIQPASAAGPLRLPALLLERFRRAPRSARLGLGSGLGCGALVIILAVCALLGSQFLGGIASNTGVNGGAPVAGQIGQTGLSATATSLPTATNTSVPTSTAQPTAIPTSAPTATPRPQPTATPVPPTPTPCPAVNCNPWGYNFTCCKQIFSPPANFCNPTYFTCVPRFATQTGYVVECKDGMYSKSGGIVGVCGKHNGYWRTLYAP